MLLNDITEKVIDGAIRVHNEVGPGLLESAYQECLHIVLKKEGLFVEKEKPIPVSFEDVKLGCGYRLDLLVEKKLVLEIKSVDHFSPVHCAQVLTYLKLGEFKLRLLLNFNVPLMKKGIKRIIN